VFTVLISDIGTLEGVLTGSIFLLPAFTHFSLSLWVYRNAEARGLADRTSWLILVLVTGVVGLIIYLFMKPPQDVVDHRLQNQLLVFGVFTNLWPLILYVWTRILFWSFNVLGLLLILAGLKLHFDVRRLERDVTLL
jgi:hypothetical protein